MINLFILQFFHLSSQVALLNGKHVCYVLSLTEM